MPAVIVAMGKQGNRGSGEPPSLGRNVTAAERYLGTLPDDLAFSPLGALLVTLAGELDAPNSATSKSMNARALLDTYSELRDLAPVEKKKGKLDDLAERRAHRRTGAAG